MDMLSIKIKISDRVYPMKVTSEDEAFVRKASSLLEERIRNYTKNLHIQDQQDLLAMVAFDCLVEVLKIEQTNTLQGNKVIQNIENWSSQIEQALTKPVA